MRKLTAKRREWHRIHTHQLYKRKKRKRKKSRSTRRAPPTRDFVRSITGAVHRIPCPENLSLEDNFEEVAKLLHDIRERSRRNRNERTYIDFKRIRTLTPSGALVLAAELDRWNHFPGNHNRRMKAVDDDEWHPNVRRLLRQMGFFELLQIPLPTDDDTTPGERFVKFRRGHVVDGELVHKFRELELAPHIDVPNTQLLFAAVTEAMTNVRHHAYAAHDPSPGVLKCWWLSAAYDTDKQEITVMIYDQGQGIPHTLPRKWSERLRALFPDGLLADDARLIEAAHDLSRSQTDDWYRGRGFERDIRRYIQKFSGRGTYRVISGKGEYTFASGSGNRSTLRSFGRSLKGTFIHWRMQLP